MKGFIDENGNDKPACVICKHREQDTVARPCYDCISLIDLALHKPNCETEFVCYEPYNG